MYSISSGSGQQLTSICRYTFRIAISIEKGRLWKFGRRKELLIHDPFLPAAEIEIQTSPQNSLNLPPPPVHILIELI
jgi:hypothetical protein